jgi:hypothetical protein
MPVLLLHYCEYWFVGESARGLQGRLAAGELGDEANLVGAGKEGAGLEARGDPINVIISTGISLYTLCYFVAFA